MYNEECAEIIAIIDMKDVAKIWFEREKFRY